MADRVGFEPTRACLRPYALSRGAPSAARPPVHGIRFDRHFGPNRELQYEYSTLDRHPAASSGRRPNLSQVSRRCARAQKSLPSDPLTKIGNHPVPHEIRSTHPLSLRERARACPVLDTGVRVKCLSISEGQPSWLPQVRQPNTLAPFRGQNQMCAAHHFCDAAYPDSPIHNLLLEG